MEFEKKTFDGMEYGIIYPVSYDDKKKYPALLYLHGAGGRDISYEQLIEDEALLITRKDESSALKDMIIFIPQTKDNNWYIRFERLIAFTKEINNRDDVDKERFNISGTSMGGYASYSLMMCIPELFHKAYILCGAGMYWNAGFIKDIKFKIFHGKKDSVVFPEEGRRMYDALIENKADAELIIYPNDNHDCWNHAFRDIERLKWLSE